MALFALGIGSIFAESHSAIRNAVEAFALAADQRNVQSLEKVMHGSFRTVFKTRGKGGYNTIDKDSYINLVKDRKIGGVKRRLKIISVVEYDNMAMVRAHLSNARVRFESGYTLVKDEGAWKIMQDATVFAVK